MNGASAYRLWVRLTDKAFTLALRGSFRSFGAGTTIQRPIRLSGEKNMDVGSHVFVGPGSWLQTIERHGSLPPRLVIGDRSVFAGNCVVSVAQGVRIGDGVGIARNVYISDHHHHYLDHDRPIVAQGLAGIAPVDIGDGAWLGQNVVICAGVRIGKGAVVAANSVVKIDVPDYCMAAGAPARIAKSF